VWTTNHPHNYKRVTEQFERKNATNIVGLCIDKRGGNALGQGGPGGFLKRGGSMTREKTVTFYAGGEGGFKPRGSSPWGL